MKTKIINILIIISTLSLIISLYFIMIKYFNTKVIQAEKTLIETTIKDLNIDYTSNGEKEILEYREKFDNDDIVATLEIPNLFNIPLVQTNDNNFYLKKGLNKKRVFGGAVFIDYRTNLNDRQINIYGHNSTKYEIPFRKLENYLNNDFTKENTIIYLKTIDENRIYQIFSVSLTKRTSKTEHYYFEYTNDEEWLKHLNILKNASIYDDNTTLQGDNEIIVLQTCLFGRNKNKLLVVTAKRLK